jgi:hypothetical protein
MGLYEVQILDSYQNDTYADGQAASIYGQYPPLVNACRPPGEWQSYDIFFRAPRFNAKGSLLKPARVTVVHNGVLVQDNVELMGPSVWLHYQPYEAHAARLPFTLQEHGTPVRFRNIWARDLQESGPVTIRADSRIAGVDPDPARYVGKYTARMGNRDEEVTVALKAGRLHFGIPFRKQSLEIIPLTSREFAIRATDAKIVFDLDGSGRATGFAFSVSGDPAFTAVRSQGR